MTIRSERGVSPLPLLIIVAFSVIGAMLVSGAIFYSYVNGLRSEGLGRRQMG